MRGLVKYFEQSVGNNNFITTFVLPERLNLSKSSRHILTADKVASCNDSTSVDSAFWRTTREATSFVYILQILLQMPERKNLTAAAQGASASTCNPTKMGLIPSTTNQFVSLLHDLCAAKLSIDAFYEAQTEGLMYDCPENYLRAETYLCDAIWALSDYVGMFTTEHLLTRKTQKSA